MSRSAKPPENMDPVRQKIWDAHMRDPERFSFVKMSRAIDGNSSYIHQFMTRRKRELPETKRIKLEIFLELPAGELRSEESSGLVALNGKGTPTPHPNSEAHFIPPEEVPARYRDVLPSFELWRLLENRAGPKFSTGDCLLIDTNLEHRLPRCYVLAMVEDNSPKAILRLSLPPHLYTVDGSTEGLKLSEIEDGQRVRARGIVTGVLLALK